MKHLNKDNTVIKGNVVFTPDSIIDFLYNNIICNIDVATVYDPAIGCGALTNRMRDNGVVIYGNDINSCGKDYCDSFTNLDIEKIIEKIDNIDLIIMNPPFNGHPKRKLYPEIFIDRMFELYGLNIPMIAIIPTGWRINQRIKSKRWRNIRDNYNISSIVTLPLDIFDDVLFHTEIVIFNVDGLRPHYFLDI